MWDIGKAVVRGGFIALKCLYQRRSSQIHDFSFSLKKPEKEEQNELKASRRRKIIKSKAETNEENKTPCRKSVKPELVL